MKKQGIPFAAATKGNAVSVIGRPQALQPEVKFRGGSDGLMIQNWPGKAAGHGHRQGICRQLEKGHKGTC